MSVSENIKKLRKQYGWSQTRLAMEANVAQQTISCIERGRNEPSVEITRALAKAFRVSVSEIIDESTDNSRTFSHKEIQLLQIFHQLNHAGQDFLLLQAESVLAQPAFRQDTSISSAV